MEAKGAGLSLFAVLRRKAMESPSNYSKFCTLKNGLKLQIRTLNNGDHEGFVKFLEQTPKETLQFCQLDFRDQEVVNSWLDPAKAHQIISLVAMELDTKKPVASIYLKKGHNASLKVGEIQQVLVAQPLQGLGLGSLLLDSLIYLASKQNLHWLKAEVVTDLKTVTKAFESRGFKTKTILEDYFVDLQGKKYDVALMVRPLMAQEMDF
jgi:GNAT superfamily N-acetyltransferase